MHILLHWYSYRLYTNFSVLHAPSLEVIFQNLIGHTCSLWWKKKKKKKKKKKLKNCSSSTITHELHQPSDLRLTYIHTNTHTHTHTCMHTHKGKLNNPPKGTIRKWGRKKRTARGSWIPVLCQSRNMLHPCACYSNMSWPDLMPH